LFSMWTKRFLKGLVGDEVSLVCQHMVGGASVCHNKPAVQLQKDGQQHQFVENS
jgi:hypothetical protein